MSHEFLPEDANEEQVLLAAQAGDEAAFGSLVRQWKRRMLGLAGRYADCHSELEDLGQEIFVRVWKGLPSYRFDAPFEHWIMRLAVRVCYDHLRKAKGRRWLHFVEPEQLAREADSSPNTEPKENALDTLRPLLNKLSAEERLVLTLLHLEERSVAETATLTGWSQANVKVRAHRAREKMKRWLRESENQKP